MNPRATGFSLHQQLNSVECLEKTGKIKTHQWNAIRIKQAKTGLFIQFFNFVGTMTGDDMSIKENLEQVNQNIAHAAIKAGKRPEDITLIMATKTVDPDRIREAIKAGGRIIAENKVQEALKKYDALKNDGAEWHFIGHLQTNKVKDVLKFANMIHSVDRLQLAEKLDQRLQQEGRAMDILIQVNTSQEDSKYGAAPEEAIPLIRQVAKYDTLHIRGLMTIGLFTKDEVKIRKCFKVLKEIYDNSVKAGIDKVVMQYLSMGMSGDYQIAIEEGANMVRIGTAIFGARNTPDAYYWPSEKTDSDRG
ncbi:MAG TPA: YggS family pyridoxal phosphate-dependent enzyme [Candidatus Brocadiaceae bacterium]|nr:YggS family pyridoxal phosphate-dependent enzyme [Candidatus Brocadiaceae bacterium]